MKWHYFIFLLLVWCPNLIADTQTQDDPRAKIAISYLKKIADGSLDIARDTALTKNCGIARRKIIRDRIKFIRTSYLRKNDTFSLESIKSDGNLSAALIRTENIAHPLKPRVLSVALILKNNQWLPAPLPASFANSGYGFDEQVEQRVKALERWMARTKINLETKHQQTAAQNLQTAIKKVEQQMSLDGMSPQDAVEHFIKQCRSKDLTNILAAMGAASGALEESLDELSAVIAEGLAMREPENEWFSLTNPSTAYAIMKFDEKRKEVAVGFYNPMLRRQSKVLYFPTAEKNGMQFVQLSPILKIALLDNDQRWQQRWRHRRDDERKLVIEVPSAVIESIKPIPGASPKELLESFLDAVHKGSFRHAIQLLPRTGKPFDDKKQLSIVLANLANQWQALSSLKSAPTPKHSLVQDERIALAPLQFAFPDRPGRIHNHNVWMLKSGEKWHLVPENTLKGMDDITILRSMNKLEKQLKSMKTEQRKELSRKMLSLVTILNPKELKPAPTEADSKTALKQYRAHLRSDDRKAALSSCAALNISDSTKTLKKFGYAIRGAKAQLSDDIILNTHTDGNWTAISVRTQDKRTEEYDYPLYLCVQTDQGAKILLDIDLRYPSNKGRKILNASQWNALKESLPADQLKNIQSLFSKHLQSVEKDQIALQKLHE